MVNDPVADFIIQLKNAGMAGKDVISVPYSKLKHEIADKLVSAGYLASAEKKGKKERKTLDVRIQYRNDSATKPRITNVERVSKPGRRVYRGVKDIRPVRYGYGMLVLSTPRGILSDEEARSERVGGEALFKIW